MPKRSKATESRRFVLDLLHGGKKAPEGLVRLHLANARRSLEARLKEKSVLERQVAQYRTKPSEPMAAVADQGSGARRAVAALRGIERLTKRKLLTPRLPIEIGGILAGSYSVRATPPYDYASRYTSVGFGSPDLSASADKNSGQMSCYAVSDTAARSGGMACSVLGVFFSPLFSPAILRVSVNPAVAFLWWINAMPTPDCHFAWSRAGLSLGITGFRGIQVDAQSVQNLALWDEPVTFCEENNFDFGSNTSRSLQTQLGVDSSHFYLVYLMCWCEAMGDVWPGSRGVASLAVTLPSINMDVQAIPIIMA